MRQVTKEKSCEYLRDLWSPTGKPACPPPGRRVAPSTSPVGRNPEREPPGQAGARVEGLTRKSPNKPNNWLGETPAQAQSVAGLLRIDRPL